jgi:hypothetical protein
MEQHPSAAARRYRVADFQQIAGVPCPCGTARRAFQDVPEFPATVHVTSIRWMPGFTITSARKPLRYSTRITAAFRSSTVTASVFPLIAGRLDSCQSSTAR